MSHVDDNDKARMVDVSGKADTRRVARAQAVVRMKSTTIQAIRLNQISKGDALGVARVAAIMASKRVDTLIPLCHTLPISQTDIDFEISEDGVRITSSVVTVGPTGVEMEALTAAAVAALTIYDMAKSIDDRMEIGEIHLVSKTGGKSGDFAW